jgi:hypothetical protein
MVRSNDLFWNNVEDMNNGGMKCKFSGHLFSENTSIYRIKWHLSGVKGRGVKICEEVPEEVQNVVRAAMDDTPDRKLKTVAGSGNIDIIQVCQFRSVLLRITETFHINSKNRIKRNNFHLILNLGPFRIFR